MQSHFSKGRLKFFRHIQAMQRFFWRLHSGEIKRGMIFCPPQFGKSEYICGAAVPYSMGKNPDLRVGLVSYGAKLAKKWGARNLDFFLKNGPELFGVEVDARRRAAENWGFADHAGGMITCGIGGSLTGEPVDFGIIDDHFKNAEDAKSASNREKVWDWYVTVFLTRLSKNARVLLINTRWHPDDLCGRLLQLHAEGNGEAWEILNLTAIAPYPDEVPEEDHPQFFPDPVGREPGEHLCPEIHAPEEIENARKTQGEAWFWAMYQGRPTPGRGEIVKEEDFRYYEWPELPIIWDPRNACWVYKDQRWKFDHCIQSWDTKYSLKDTKTGAWVAGQVWGLIGARAYLLDEVRGRWGVESTIRECEALVKKWPIATKKLFEPKASGPKIVERLSLKIPGFQTWTCEGDKETRFRAQEHWFTGNNVFLLNPQSGAWVRPWRTEICTFPRGTFKDRVDACGQALDYFSQMGGFAPPDRQDRPEDPMAELRQHLKGK